MNERDRLIALNALEKARVFIRNGVDLGFIRMPDADTPDPAHQTLPMIEAAISALSHPHASAQEAAPEGWKLVPVEPDDKMMLRGGFSFAGRVPNEEVFPEVRKVWDRMLSAAPSAITSESAAEAKGVEDAATEAAPDREDLVNAFVAKFGGKYDGNEWNVLLNTDEMVEIMSALAAPVQALQGAEAVAALRELVECKNLKLRIDAYAGQGSIHTQQQEEELAAIRKEYESRKPAAWKRAREVISGAPMAESPVFVFHPEDPFLRCLPDGSKVILQRKLAPSLTAPVQAAPTEDALWALLPNTAWYLDPPDGGDVPLIEQLRRMSEDARKYREAIAQQAEAATEICRSVAELPDRNSPEDWPEAMLVTHDELRAIVLAALATPAPVAADTLTETLIALAEKWELLADSGEDVTGYSRGCNASNMNHAQELRRLIDEARSKP